jgi:hypothetical protein
MAGPIVNWCLPLQYCILPSQQDYAGTHVRANQLHVCTYQSYQSKNHCHNFHICIPCYSTGTVFVSSLLPFFSVRILQLFTIVQYQYSRSDFALARFRSVKTESRLNTMFYVMS